MDTVPHFTGNKGEDSVHVAYVNKQSDFLGLLMPIC